ncbi:MAG: putative secreted protein [Acidobacteria bacterium]|nr:putative secreted protein [Acidobacteriota bacterium]
MKFASRTYRQYFQYLTLGLFSLLIVGTGLYVTVRSDGGWVKVESPSIVRGLSSVHGRDARATEQVLSSVHGRDAHATEQVLPSVHGRDARATASAAYGQMELGFEANRGQTDKSVNFLTRGAGYTLFLKAAEATLQLQNSDCGSLNEATADSKNSQSEIRKPNSARPHSPICDQQSALRLQFVDANAKARAEGLDQLHGSVNYFVGNDPAGWRTDIPTFSRVRYEGVYPGIDLVYYGNQRQLEYDLVVAPGGDPHAVKMRFAGAGKVTVGTKGDLLLAVGKTTMRQPRPVIYQEVSGARRTIAGNYTITADGEVGFAIGEYDTDRPLVIDPTLVYSSYLGGGGTDEARDIKTDSAGNAYICGNTSSVNFPVANAFQGTFGGGNFFGARDAFVTKINASGTALIYSTYLGGGGDDKCGRLAVDAAGNVYLSGETTSLNFPTANAFQSTYGGGASDGFVTKLNASGSALFYSTYLGGSLFDAAHGIDVDSTGKAYVTGRTTSANFPVVNAVQGTFSGGANADAFVTKFSANGLGLVYSTYLGGSGGTGFDAGLGIAVDSIGNAYVTGETSSTNFPLVNPIQNTFGGGFPDGDAFITKINAAGTAFIFSTYLGGGDNDVAQAIAVDANGNCYLTGSTASTNFPTVNPFQSFYGGGGDAFVSKINTSGTALIFSSYLGGISNDVGNDIALDSAAHAYVTGGTVSTNFPLLNPVQGTYGGGTADAFLSKFNVAGTGLIYSTYLGGSNSDSANGVAADAAGSAYVAGITASTNFPTLNPFQGTKAVAEDAFVTKVSDPQPTVVQFSSSNYSAPEECTFVTITLNRLGDTTGETTVDYTTSDGTAIQRTDYTLGGGTVKFAAGEVSKTFRVLLSEDAYVEGDENFNLILSNPIGGGLGSPAAATLTITDDDTANPPIINPIDDANIFVRQHYHDFLAREGDSAGVAFWTNTITQCGADQNCINSKRVTVSDAFYFEPEFQQTGAYVYRVYRESFGNSQPFPNPNPDPAHPNEEKKVPLYLPFMRDRVRVRGGAQLAQQQLDFANAFVQRLEFLTRYPLTLDGPAFVDAVLATLSNDIGVNLVGQRQALIDLYNQGSNVTAGRANVIYRLADDNATNPINNRAFIDAEYNRAFVFTAYAGYLRRNADMPGFLFWLGQVNSAPLRDVTKQHSIVCSFITAAEYQQRFSSVVTHNNGECQ